MIEFRITAIIVTYNRLEHLQKVIAAIRCQTMQVSAIIVINNESTDGTKEWLSAQSELISIHQANTGGSGGFFSGTKKAMELQNDWLWMMDDDVAPEADCLEHLLNYSDISQCLIPLHIDTNGSLLPAERWIDPATARISNLFNRSYQNGKKFWFTNMGSFEGMLIHRSIVERTGFPDPRFFIMHDDLLFGLMASRFTNLCVVADARMQKLPVQRSAESRYRSLYFQFRNLWMLEEYLDREWPGYSAYRKRRIKLQFLYECYTIMRSSEYKSRYRAFRFLWRAFLDYKRKKAGPGF